MWPTSVLWAPCDPHVGLMSFALRDASPLWSSYGACFLGTLETNHRETQRLRCSGPTLWSIPQTIRIRIRNLYYPYFTEKHQGTRKYINKDIWIPTHYKQTKTLSENTKQWYKIIEYNVERKWQWNDLYTLWHIPQAIAAIIHPEDTEPDEGATAVKRYNRIDYELISHSYDTVVHYVPSR